MRTVLFLSIVLAALLPRPASAEDSLDAVIARTIHVYGGEAALRQVVALRQTGQITSRMRGGVGDTVREFERPDKLRVVTRYGTDTESRIVDGKSGWRQGQFVAGAPLDAMVLQAARFNLPLWLLDRKAQLVDNGTKTIEGHPVRALELPVAPGLMLTIDIDVASGMIVRTSGRGGQMPNGAPMEFITRYTDFRVVGGILFPFHEWSYANGFVTGDSILMKIEVLKALPPATFRP